MFACVNRCEAARLPKYDGQITSPRALERGFDLGGMVGIVIDDADAVRFTAQLEAATCTRKLSQCLGHALARQAK